MVSIKEKNPILAKDEVGKSKPFTHDLPSGNFTYGAATRKNQYDVSKLTTEWMESRGSVSKQNNEKDFAAMNRNAIKDGVVKANQVGHYRNEKPTVKTLR